MKCINKKVKKYLFFSDGPAIPSLFVPSFIIYILYCFLGQITIVDNDDVDLTNLHRQILYSEFDIGVSKVNTAFCKLNKYENGYSILYKPLICLIL